MNTRHRRASLAALALVVSLTLSPVASASALDWDGELRFRDRVVRIVKHLKRFFGGATSFEDALNPPRP